jgi:hypothetical protein
LISLAVKRQVVHIGTGQPIRNLSCAAIRNLVHRLLGAQHLRQRRQPLGDRGRIVVDHVVDTASAVLDRRHRRLRCVGDMDERPHAAAIAD